MCARRAFMLTLVIVLLPSIVLLLPGSSDKDLTFAKRFLKKFHYISTLNNGNHDFRTAVELFQRFMHLPVTGDLDNATITEMKKPRCGVPDIEDRVETTSTQKVSKRYAVSSLKWNRTHLTYGLFNTGNDMSADKVKSILNKAFQMWSNYTVLNFRNVSDVNTADIKIRFFSKKHPPCRNAFDGPRNILGHARYPPDGNIHIDNDEHFTDGNYSGINLLNVFAHEIGHAIGVHHSDERGAIMYPEYIGYKPNIKLHRDDINAVFHLYGCFDRLVQYCQLWKKYCFSLSYIRGSCKKTCKVC